MSLALVSTCVGGRRAAQVCPPSPVVRVVFEAPKKRGNRANPAPNGPGRKFGMTARECQVVDTVIRTGTCVVAANVLGLSIKTVEAHMSKCRDKASVGTNYQLIAAYVAAQHED